MGETLRDDPFFGTSGPRDAKILIVGEAWGAEEATAGRPFVGQSGKEFSRILAEGGVNREACLLTNVVSAQPPRNELWTQFETNAEAKAHKRAALRGLFPDSFVSSELARLSSLVEILHPSLVIAVGNYALWATTNCASNSATSTGGGATVNVPSGILSYRGSMLVSDVFPGVPGLKVLPLIHPAAILRAWYNRAVTVHDLKTRVPLALRDDWRPADPPTILAPPTFEQARYQLCEWLCHLDKSRPLRLACDIETARGLITCLGIGTNRFALVIPFVRLLPGRQFESFWPPEEEVVLTQLLRRILVHPFIQIEGQNFLYDTQYIQQFLRCTPRLDFDTMLAHHLLFPGTPKALDYLSSLYCKYHWYWKDDNKEWDMSADITRHLEYNGEDIVRTYECAEALRESIRSMGFAAQWEDEKRKNSLALRMMNRGVRIDTSRRAALAFELAQAQTEIQARLVTLIPPALVDPEAKTPWYNSPKQQQTLFYETLGLQGKRNRKTGQPSVDDEALKSLRKENPELRSIFDLLLTLRSVGVFHSTFVSAPLDPDGRMRCSFNPAGTETFRWSSSKNAFGRGTNLQNIPKGEEQ